MVLSGRGGRSAPSLTSLSRTTRLLVRQPLPTPLTEDTQGLPSSQERFIAVRFVPQSGPHFSPSYVPVVMPQRFAMVSDVVPQPIEQVIEHRRVQREQLRSRLLELILANEQARRTSRQWFA